MGQANRVIAEKVRDDIKKKLKTSTSAEDIVEKIKKEDKGIIYNL